MFLHASTIQCLSSETVSSNFVTFSAIINVRFGNTSWIGTCVHSRYCKVLYKVRYEKNGGCIQNVITCICRVPLCVLNHEDNARNVWPGFTLVLRPSIKFVHPCTRGLTEQCPVYTTNIAAMCVLGIPVPKTLGDSSIGSRPCSLQARPCVVLSWSKPGIDTVRVGTMTDKSYLW